MVLIQQEHVCAYLVHNREANRVSVTCENVDYAPAGTGRCHHRRTAHWSLFMSEPARAPESRVRSDVPVFTTVTRKPRFWLILGSMTKDERGEREWPQTHTPHTLTRGTANDPKRCPHESLYLRSMKTPRT